MKPLFLLFFICWKGCLFAQTPYTTDSCTLILQERIAHLLDDELFQRSQVGLAVYDLTTQSVVYTHNALQLMRPASTQKLFTAITALDTLREKHAFTTAMYADGEVKNDTLWGNLVVRGGFDVMFSEREMQVLAHALHNECIRHIEGTIVLDLTMKEDKKWGKGWCWDDKEATLVPLTYDGQDKFYEQFKAMLHAQGIAFRDSVRFQKTPQQLYPIALCGHELQDLLLPTLKHSSNIHAESIFYQLATLRSTENATAQQAADAYHNLITKIGHRPDDYTVADGSGLSLYNYLSPQLLVDLLRYAHQHPNIYKSLMGSLPIMGIDGTLKKRCVDTEAQGKVQAKTGTLTAVSSLAGYLTTAHGHLYCFAIINQGLRKVREGRDFQDKICIALTEKI